MAHDDIIPSDDNPEEIDHEFTDNAVCPYCGHENLDSWELGDRGDDECGEDECGKCGKEYTWTRHVTVDYSTKKLGEAG